MECIRLMDEFHREVEVLELNDEMMIYAIDEKNEIKDLCSIEKIDLESREITHLLTLDYTRLWESFRTYEQMPDFFYAVNVLADYRVRLRKIDKYSWECTEDIVISPEGELLNLYSLNEDYMVITDEVDSDHHILSEWNIDPKGMRYINLCYLYEIKTAKKYPIKDALFTESNTENVFIRHIGAEPVMVYEVFTRDEYDESPDGGSGIYTVPVSRFIEQVKLDGTCALDLLVSPLKDSFDYVRLMKCDSDGIIFRRRKITEREEELVKLLFEHNAHDIHNEHTKYTEHIEEVMCSYTVPEGEREHEGSISYDLYQPSAFWCDNNEDAEKRTIRRLPDGPSYSYDSKYGDFDSLFENRFLITTYYDEVFMKEYEYHEFVAIHDLETGEVETVSARCERTKDTLVLLKSFLAL